MNRLMNILEPLKDYAKAHPYILGVTTVLGLMILFLRKIHYRFIVYPGTHLSNQMCKGGPINKIPSDINILTIEE